MKKAFLSFILYFFACFFGYSLSAQVSDFYNYRKAELIRIDKQFKPGEQSLPELVNGFVHSTFSQKYSSSFYLDNYVESPIGYHLTFSQHYNGIKVYNGTLKINIDKRFRILSILLDIFIIDDLQLNIVSKDDVENIWKARHPEMIIKNADHVVFFSNNIWVDAICLQAFNSANSISYEWVLDGNANVMQQRNLNLYSSNGGKDSIVSARAFLPDPLTTAGKTYGFPYANRSDSDVVELNNERKLVRIPVTFSGDTFYLSNKYAKVVEASLPITTIALIVADTLFDYGRGKPQFEDVNAYYHINAYQKYIQSIGIINMGQMQYQIDAHGFNGADQSAFIPLTVPPGIYFGIGGVNDAEDGEVIVHEYAHALSWSISPNTTSGLERMAIEEGNCDFLASSYTRSINSFNWELVFPWDMHNIFFQGRTIKTSKKYPTNMVFDYYQNAEIWSSALMKIWESCGKEIADNIVLNSLYSLSNDITMPQAARLVIIADSVLYGGIHYQKIFSSFAQYGILQWGLGLVEMPNEQIQVINSLGFSTGTGVAEIILPDMQDFQFFITDISGKEIQRGTAPSGKLQLNPTSFLSGVYFIRLQTTEAIYFTKVIKY